MIAVGGFTPLHRGGAGEPQLLLHGFMDTWRTWELVLPRLERARDILAPTLPGHAGGPPLPTTSSRPPVEAVLDVLEALMDEAGFATAHIAGNSLGGHLALRLAERGRARSVVALAPAADPVPPEVLALQRRLGDQAKLVAPYADRVVATAKGLRQATQLSTVRYEHLPPELVAHQMRGIAACDVAGMLDRAEVDGWPLHPDRVGCPVRVVWGTADRILAFPQAAAPLRAAFPWADEVVLDDVGHCPQLDVPLETAELVLGWP